MVIVHYIPSIDRTSGGVGAYMQLLAGELGKLVDLHVVSHRSAHMLEMPHAKLHLVAGGLAGLRKAKREWQTLIDWLKPNAVHINGCRTPGCALMQKWAKELNCKVVLTPHGMLEPWIVKRHYYTRKLPALWLYQKAAVARRLLAGHGGKRKAEPVAPWPE